MQRGCFTIFGKSRADLRADADFLRESYLVTIPSECKSQIVNDLNLLGVNAFLVYPDGKGFPQVVKEYGVCILLNKRNLGAIQS